ncbi:MAG: RluA family pseudouridine synthase [Erythrobacter sp.]
MSEDAPQNPSKDVRQFTVSEDDAGIRLDRWFKRNLLQIGFATISRWARTGQIRVDGKRAKPEDRLEEGQVLRVPPGGENTKRGPKKPRELTEAELAETRAMVMKETPSAIVLNKPPGLATQGGSKTHKHVDGLLDAFVPLEGEPNAGIRPRLVHRLDKDTSGVLLIARTPGAAASYSKRFSSRSARKVYWALIVGVPEVFEGTIDAPLAKQPGTGGEKMHVDHEEGQSAKTRYRVVERAGNSAAWVELEPLTGRTHQLRAHMAAIGHPIVGDGKYGGQDAFLTGSVSRKMHLHARRLVISQPGERSGKLDITAPLPEHFEQTMQHMGFNTEVSNADPLIVAPPERSRAEKKQAARKFAKQYRKDRRGERRTRTAGTRGNTGGDPVGRRKKPNKRSGKPNGKPAGKRK